MSVYEPGGVGGCQNQDIATVRETSNNHQCLLAVNAGFFNTSTAQCLGINMQLVLLIHYNQHSSNLKNH